MTTKLWPKSLDRHMYAKQEKVVKLSSEITATLCRYGTFIDLLECKP